MIIKILGTGCPKCKALQTSLESAVKQLWIEVTIQKIDDMNDIMQYDIMQMPGLVIDEKVVMTGKVPSVEELVEIIPNWVNYKDWKSDCKKDWWCCCECNC